MRSAILVATAGAASFMALSQLQGIRRRNAYAQRLYQLEMFKVLPSPRGAA
jgi:hypothetical protein